MQNLPDYLTSQTLVNQVWSLTDDGQFHVSLNSFGSILSSQTVTLEELDKHHSALGPAIRRLVARNTQCREWPHAEGSNVIATLDILQGRYRKPSYLMPENTVLFDIFKMDPPLGETVYLIAQGAEVSYFEHDGTEFAFATYLFSRSVPATQEVLEANHPGWMKRYQIGTELALEHKDLMRYVFFGDKVEPGVALPNMVF